MKNKILTITIISLLTLSSFGFFFMAFLNPVGADNELTLPAKVPMDMTPEMIGEKEVAIRNYAAKVGSKVATDASPIGEPANIGDNFTFELSDDYYGEYDEEFTILMEGEHCLILITKDAYESFDGTYYNFSNPYGTWDRYGDLITPAQLEGLMWEFDNVIYGNVTDVFGFPIPRGDEGQKIWTLIFNIRDESYYDDSQTSYAVGYFSASTSAENNKNIMHIDTYDWENRAGEDSTRVMEGVFAHEFQHLVHFDQDSDEESWVDEGCADLAGYLCGYGHWDSHLTYYMVFHWLTSLTFWGGGLEDYGASYLFALYLYEHYGGKDFFRDLVQEEDNGIAGIQKTLYANGYCISFDKLFDHWTIANYLDDTSIWDGRYGYDSLVIGGDDTWGWTIDDALTYYWGEPIFDKPFELTGWWGTPQPYTAHYYRFAINHKFTKAFIDGDDFAGTIAYSEPYEWYSGANAWAWRSFSQTFNIPTEGETTLNFMTYFEIEDDWDYGYVEVYDKTLGEWYTLNDPNARMYVYNTSLGIYEEVAMREFILHRQDNPSCPNDQEPFYYNDTGKFYAFTGASGGWIPISMDLTPFAGSEIELHFRLWQDGAFTLQNMYVDDIEITNGVLPLDTVEDEDGWSTDGWIVTDGILDNDFEVTVLKVAYAEWPSFEFNWVRHMWVWHSTQSGSMWIPRIKKNDPHFNVAIISNRADHILTSDYTFAVDKVTSFWKWWW